MWLRGLVTEGGCMGHSNYLCRETPSSLNESDCTSERQRRISAQMCFSRSLVRHVCLYAWTVYTSTNEAVCGTVGLSLNTQRPRELPRAERTASVCVLVPRKQGNLENTKGAANKHNLIPPSSYTWLWIMQRYSTEAGLFLCVCACKRQCQSLVDRTRRVACLFLHFCICACLCMCVMCVHEQMRGMRV